jgi:hypothetical protein
LLIPTFLFSQVANAEGLLFLDNEPSAWESAKTFFDNMAKFFKWWNDSYIWLQHLPEHILNGSTYLLAWIYELVADFMLGVPTELFTSDWFNKASIVFAGIGFFTSLILPKLEGLRQTIFPLSSSQSKTFMDWKTLLKRLPIAVIGSGLAPKAFELVFGCLDKFTSSIIQVGRDQILSATTHANILDFGWLDGAALIGFDIAFIIS